MESTLMATDKIIFTGYIRQGFRAAGDEKEYFMVECEFNGFHSTSVSVMGEHENIESIGFLMQGGARACSSNILAQIHAKIEDNAVQRVAEKEMSKFSINKEELSNERTIEPVTD